MKYSDISSNIRKYIRKTTYNDMSDDGQKLYRKSAKKLVRKIAELEDDNESDDEYDNDDDDDISEKFLNISIVPHYREITFVGMRYRGNHHFCKNDIVKLEKDDDNPHDRNAVKVMVKDGKKWKHAAFVTRDDAIYLRGIPDFEKKPLRFEKNYAASTTYHIQTK